MTVGVRKHEKHRYPEPDGMLVSTVLVLGADMSVA